MLEAGTTLQNRYLVTNQIGQGGMGAVFIATDQRFGSMVAVKETFFSDANMRKAFEREAKLLNSLRHPALPRVSDHFIENDGQFLVMEYIPGDDLAQLLESNGKPFPVATVIDWANQLLDALEYLHAQETPIIHRDIKPQNLKLTARGQIILLDFGLAKGTPANLSRVTNTGSIFGYSRNYAPLEQIQGAGTDTRSDLYALAATLYHLLTAQAPPDAVTRATSVINGQPDPLRLASDLCPEVPIQLAQLLSRALAQNASLRPASATAMRQELAALNSGSGFASALVNEAGATILDQVTQRLTAQQQQNATFVAPGTTPIPPLRAAATTVDPLLQSASAGVAHSPSADSVVTRIARPPVQTKYVAPIKGRPRNMKLLLVPVAVVAVAVLVIGAMRLRTNNDTQAPSQLTAVPAAPAIGSEPTPQSSPFVVDAQKPQPDETKLPASPQVTRKPAATNQSTERVAVKPTLAPNPTTPPTTTVSRDPVGHGEHSSRVPAPPATTSATEAQQQLAERRRIQQMELLRMQQRKRMRVGGRPTLGPRRY